MPGIGLNKREETIGDKLRALFKGGDEPLDKKVILAHYRVKTSIGRLNNYLYKLEERDRELFQNIVDALIKRDEKRAKMYAREVAEIRRIAKQLITAKYALEQVALKLETFLIFGGATQELAPILGVIREAVNLTKAVGSDVWIELYASLRELEAALGTSVAGLEVELDVGLDAEAKKILEEAKIAAEHAIKEKYAELPKIVSVEEAKAGQTA